MRLAPTTGASLVTMPFTPEKRRAKGEFVAQSKLQEILSSVRLLVRCLRCGDCGIWIRRRRQCLLQER